MPISNYGSAVLVTASTSSAATALPNGQGGKLEIVNLSSSVPVYGKLGGSTTTAVVLDSTARSGFVIPPGSALEVDTSTSSYIALITSSGSASVVLQQGA